MWNFISKHKFGLLATLIFHFALIFGSTYVYMPIPNEIKEHKITLDFSADPAPELIKEKLKAYAKQKNNNSNKAVNESAPKNVKSGDYNEFDKEPSETSKAAFEKQLDQELKELEDQVIKDQREAGYGYSQEEIDKLLHSSKNKELDHVEEQKPRSESVFNGNTNISYKLQNRYDTKLNVPVYMCQYGGVVVINIAVDRSGKVVSAKLDEESSQTTDPCLIKAAIQGAKNTRFNNKSSSEKIQLGSITYQFIEQ